MGFDDRAPDGPGRPEQAVLEQAVREQWADAPRWQQIGVLALGSAEIVLTALAVVDLVRRPKSQVRGPKALWFAGLAVQPFGPVSYLLLGRRSAT